MGLSGLQIRPVSETELADPGAKRSQTAPTPIQNGGVLRARPCWMGFEAVWGCLDRKTFGALWSKPGQI
jgi:hypothetical protein